ncbi:MAG: squalene/phytoene synthase family protein [Sphingomonadaceae bacterium]
MSELIGMRSTARAAARKAVAAIVRRSGTSFALGMRILARPRREAMHAVYAFCRVIDDIGDEPGARAAKRAALAQWRDEIGRLYAGRASHPVAVALEEPVRRFALPRAEFERIIEGVEIDVDGPVVAPPAAALSHYCRCVAGAVGMLSMPIFGAPAGPASDHFAIAMGEGLQLANIVRDVGTDAREGRIYLPAELLARFDLPADPARLPAAPRLGEARAALAQEARRRIDEAFALTPALGWRVVRPALLMGAAYRATLDRLEAGRFLALEPPRFSSLEKLAIAARAFLTPPEVRQPAQA